MRQIPRLVEQATQDRWEKGWMVLQASSVFEGIILDEGQAQACPQGPGSQGVTDGEDGPGHPF